MAGTEKMTTLYMGLLQRAPLAAEWDARPDELAALQEAHLANNRRLVEEGHLLLLGPFTDDRFWRGVFVFQADSLAEAEAFAASDPSVQAGRLAFEFHPRLVEKGRIKGTQ